MTTWGYIRTSKALQDGQPGMKPETQQFQLQDAGVDLEHIYRDLGGQRVHQHHIAAGLDAVARPAHGRQLREQGTGGAGPGQGQGCEARPPVGRASGDARPRRADAAGWGLAWGDSQVAESAQEHGPQLAQAGAGE